MLNNRLLIFFLSILGLTFCQPKPQAYKEKPENSPERPNIVIIYVDDLGYGDVGCYGAKSVKTPNIDRLAENGLKFTDAHCSAATCTPSRYSLLTGNYAFRMKAGILGGDDPLLIRPGTPTLASKLKEVGYQTAVIGKWHLGLGDGEVNWNEDVKPGPLEIGFDYGYLIPSTGDRVPSVYLENYRVVGLKADDPLEITFTDNAAEENPYDNPTGLSAPDLLRMPADTQHSGTIVNGVSRIGFMGGGKSAYWKDEDFPDLLSEKAATFIKENKSQAFFLYFSFHDIHVPRIVHERFLGKSPMGPRGDAIAQMDWVTGQIVKTLEEEGLANNTLIIFTSDNGPVLNDGYGDQAVESLGEHKPSGIFRGGKYSIYEAGHRVPTIAYWPSKIQTGESTALWNQVDLMASLSKLTGFSLSEQEAIDSEEMLAVILGTSTKGRKTMFSEAFTHAYRDGNWKYIAPTKQAHTWIKAVKNIEGGVSTKAQLYNLEEDPGEQNDLAEQYPEKVKEMQAALDQIISKTNGK